MTDAKPIRVRVLPSRSLSLANESGGTDHHVAGDELDLPPDEAKQLVDDGFVEPA
jgi:hypothetical protein